MSACAPTRTSRIARATRAVRPPRSTRPDNPHGPPPPRRRVRPSGLRPSGLRPSGADLSASLTVFLIAVPMSLGLAVAIGAPLQAGLVAAAVGGIVAGLVGGTPLLVSGPSAGLTVVTAELIQIYGWRTTCAITVCAGLLQIGLGSLRVARGALAVSPAIVHGTLAGIGVAIALAQLHVVLGGSPQSSAVANALALPAQLSRMNLAAVLIGSLTIAILILWPRIPGRTGRGLRKIPAALASVVLATAVAAFAAPGLARVDLPSWRAHVLPDQPPHGPLLALAAAVLTVMLVGSLESLLSAVAVDKMSGQKSDLDRELRGQGVANAMSGMLGGLPVSGGSVRSSANVRAGATGRASTVLHGIWVLLAAGLLVVVLEWIPLTALAALVMVVGIQMVNFAHIRNVHKHREFLAYATTVAGVILAGVLEGVLAGIAVAVAISLHRLARTRITVTEEDGVHRVRVRGQLTFLAVPRLSRMLSQVPSGATASVELDGSFMDHAAYETLQEWQDAQRASGGAVKVAGRSGTRIAEPAPAHHCRPWLPWHNHHCTQPPAAAEPRPADGQQSAGGRSPSSHPGSGQLASGLRAFQRNTAPLVRDELARLARDGQQPTQLFLTCADSRLVTSMITSSGPGDLFTVRNVGNLVPLPGAESADDSVGAAIEYAVDVLQVSSITVCGHSGCGAMQALISSAPATAGEAQTPLKRWLQHGLPSLERMRAGLHPHRPRLSDRPSADAVEELCLSNVVQQLHHLSAHESVARRLADGSLELHGMYFHVAEAQAYLLEHMDGAFAPVQPDALAS